MTAIPRDTDRPGGIELDQIDLPPEAGADAPGAASRAPAGEERSPRAGEAAPGPADRMPGIIRATLIGAAVATALVWGIVGVLYLVDWLL